MRFKGLDLNLLVALDALLTEGSVTAAAERLHVTQSAASYALARLREALGDDLLVKSGKKMVRTPYADELRPELRDIFMRVEATIRSGRGFTPATSSRHFRIATSDYVAQVFLSAAIVAASRLAPGLRIDLLPVFSDDIFENLQDGKIDLIVAPEEFCRSGNRCQTLFKDVLVCLAWIRNDAVGDRLTLQQYLEAKHVLLKPLPEERALDEIFFRQRGIKREAAATATTYAMLPDLVVGSPWIATVPRRFAELYKRRLPLKAVETDFEMPVAAETLQWHASRDRDKALEWLREQIAAAVAKLLPPI